MQWLAETLGAWAATRSGVPSRPARAMAPLLPRPGKAVLSDGPSAALRHARRWDAAPSRRRGGQESRGATRDTERRGRALGLA